MTTSRRGLNVHRLHRTEWREHGFVAQHVIHPSRGVAWQGQRHLQRAAGPQQLGLGAEQVGELDELAGGVLHAGPALATLAVGQHDRPGLEQHGHALTRAEADLGVLVVAARRQALGRDVAIAAHAARHQRGKAQAHGHVQVHLVAVVGPQPLDLRLTVDLSAHVAREPVRHARGDGPIERRRRGSACRCHHRGLCRGGWDERALCRSGQGRRGSRCHRRSLRFIARLGWRFRGGIGYGSEWRFSFRLRSGWGQQTLRVGGWSQRECEPAVCVG